MYRLPIALCLLGGACTDLELRVCNHTEYAVTHLDAAGHTGLNLAAEECSPYRIESGDAFGFTAASFYVGADYFSFVPLDFLGESPLEPSQWTYDLKINDYAARSCIAVVAREQ